MKVGKFGTRKHFGGIGNEDEDGLKWQETDGTWRVRACGLRFSSRRAQFFDTAWPHLLTIVPYFVLGPPDFFFSQCTNGRSKTEHRVLAVLHSRIATRGTRIEVSTEGQSQMDTIVLTALLVLHGEADWKAFTNRPVPSPYSFYQARLVMPPVPHVTAVTLTLSTNSFLNGLLAVGGQLMYGMKTTGNKTTLSKYTWEQRPRLEEFATIEWHGNTVLGRQRSVLTYRGQKHELEDFMWSSFLGNRCVQKRRSLALCLSLSALLRLWRTPICWGSSPFSPPLEGPSILGHSLHVYPGHELVAPVGEHPAYPPQFIVAPTTLIGIGNPRASHATSHTEVDGSERLGKCGRSVSTNLRHATFAETPFFSFSKFKRRPELEVSYRHTHSTFLSFLVFYGLLSVSMACFFCFFSGSYTLFLIIIFSPDRIVILTHLVIPIITGYADSVCRVSCHGFNGSNHHPRGRASPIRAGIPWRSSIGGS